MSQVEQVIMGTTRRGARKPIYNGYEYIADRKNATYTNYRCCEKKHKCLARIKIYNKPPYNIKQLPIKRHNHPPRIEEQIEAEQSRCRMSQLSTQLSTQMVNNIQRRDYSTNQVEKEHNHSPNNEGLAAQLVNNIQRRDYSSIQVEKEHNHLPNKEGFAAHLETPPRRDYSNIQVEKEHDHPPNIKGFATQRGNTQRRDYSSVQVDKGHTHLPNKDGVAAQLENSPQGPYRSFQVEKEHNYLPNKEGLAAKLDNPPQGPYHSFLVEEEYHHPPKIEGLAAQLVNTPWGVYPRIPVEVTPHSAEQIASRDPKSVLASDIISRPDFSPNESTKKWLINRDLGRANSGRANSGRANSSEEINTANSNVTHSQLENKSNKYMESFKRFCQGKGSGDKNVYIEYSPTNTPNDLSNKIVKIQSIKETIRPRSLVKSNTCPPKSEIYVQPSVTKNIHQKKTYKSDLKNNSKGEFSTFEEYLISKIRGEPQYLEPCDLKMKDARSSSVGSNETLSKIDKELENNKLKIGCVNTIDKHESDLQNVINNNKPSIFVKENHATTTEIKHHIMEPPTKKRKLPPLRSIYDKTNEKIVDNNALQLKNTEEYTNKNEKIIEDKALLENPGKDTNKNYKIVENKALQLKNTEEYTNKNEKIIEDKALLENPGKDTNKNEKIVENKALQLKNTEEYINENEKIIVNNTLQLKKAEKCSKFNDEKLFKQDPVVVMKKLKIDPGQVVNIKGTGWAEEIEDITIKMEPIDSTDVCETSTGGLTNSDQDLKIKLEEIKVKEENKNIYNIDGVSLETVNTKKNICQNIMKTLHKIANVSSEIQTYFTIDSTKDNVESDILVFDLDNSNHIEDVILKEVKKVRKLIVLQDEISHRAKENILRSKEKLNGQMSLMMDKLELLKSKANNESDKRDSILRNLLCTSNDNTTDARFSENKIQDIDCKRVSSALSNKRKMPPLKSIYKTTNLNSITDNDLNKLPTMTSNIEESIKARFQNPIQPSEYSSQSKNNSLSNPDIGLHSVTNNKEEYPKFVKISSSTILKSNKVFMKRKSLNIKNSINSSFEYLKQCEETKTNDSKSFKNNCNTDISIDEIDLTKHEGYYNNVSSPPNLIIDIKKSSVESLKQSEETKKNYSTNFINNCDTEILIDKSNLTKQNGYYNNVSSTPNLIIDKNCFVSEKALDICPVCKAELDFTLYLDMQIMTALCICNLNILVLLDPEQSESVIDNVEQNYTSSSMINLQNVDRSNTNSNFHMYKTGDELQLSKDGYSDKQGIILRNLLCSDKKAIKNNCVEEKKSECEAKTIVCKDIFSKPLKKRKMPPLYSIYASSNKTTNKVQTLNKLPFTNSNLKEVLKVKNHNQNLENVHMNHASQIPLDLTTKNFRPNAEKSLYSISSSTSQEASQSTLSCLSYVNTKANQVTKESKDLNISNLSVESLKQLEVLNPNENRISNRTINTVAQITTSSKAENTSNGIMKTVHRANTVQSNASDDLPKADISNKDILRIEENIRKLNQAKEKAKIHEEIVIDSDISTLSDDLKMYVFEKMESSIKWRMRGPTIWEFLVRLLLNSETNPLLVRWEHREVNIFRLMKPDCLARLWNSRGKCNKKVPYKNFARAVRYWYRRGGIEVVQERQLVYKLGARAIAYMSKLQKTNEPS